MIDGPARLAGLDVSEVQEAMVAEARDEPGALPLVENALHWLWEKRTDGRLSGKLFSEQGGVAGILSRCADDLLADLEHATARPGAGAPVPHGADRPGGPPPHPPADPARPRRSRSPAAASAAAPSSTASPAGARPDGGSGTARCG